MRLIDINCPNCGCKIHVEPEPEPQWIPCSERLPEEETAVLITDEDGDVYVARYQYNSWIEDPEIEWWAGDYRAYPTAWMPLPEPYEEKDNERA